MATAPPASTHQGVASPVAKWTANRTAPNTAHVTNTAIIPIRMRRARSPTMSSEGGGAREVGGATGGTVLERSTRARYFVVVDAGFGVGAWPCERDANPATASPMPTSTRKAATTHWMAEDLLAAPFTCNCPGLVWV